MTVAPSHRAGCLAVDLNRREPRIWWQYLTGVVAFFGANLVMSMVAGIILVVAQGPSAVLADPQGAVMRYPFPALFTGMLVYTALSTVLYWLIVRFLAQRPVYELGLRAMPAELGAGLGIGIGAIALSTGLIATFGGYRVESVQVGSGILVGLAVGLGPGFAEEFFFRGILQRNLDKQIGSWAALAVTCVVFGLVHISNSEATVGGVIGIVLAGGLFLGGAYLYTRRLWLAIGVHTGWNFAQSGIFGSEVSGAGLTSTGLLKPVMDGPTWLTGGSMGMEGSVITTVVGSIIGIVLILLARRRGNLRARRQNRAPVVDLRPEPARQL